MRLRLRPQNIHVRPAPNERLKSVLEKIERQDWRELFQCTQPTLQHLTIEMGSVSLCEDETARKHKIPRWNKALVFEIFGDGRMPKAATVFPQLQTFQVGMMDLDAVPLLKFLHAQPKLSQVDFIAIILSTRREGWGFLIAQLPETVQRWTVYKPAYFHRGKRMELDPARLPRGSGWECVSNESGFAEFRRVPG